VWDQEASAGAELAPAGPAEKELIYRKFFAEFNKFSV
jgi:hypothetical protein